MSYDQGDPAASDAEDPGASTSSEAESEAESVATCEASATGLRRARGWHVPRSRRAFHRFYREHFGLVWSMVRRFGVPPAQHDDVVQEVWLVAYRRLHTLEPEASAKAWLSSITRRVASRQRRTEHRQRRKLAALGVATDPPRSAPPAWADGQDARRLLAALLAELDDEQRDVLVLAQVHGFTGPEIAAVLEIPLNTAYSRLRLARRRVERFAADAGAEEARVIRALRRGEEPPPRAAARVWILIASDLGLSAATTTTVASSAAVGGLASVKTFAVAVAVGLVGLLGARGLLDARVAGARDTVTAGAITTATSVPPRAVSERAPEPAPREVQPDASSADPETESPVSVPRSPERSVTTRRSSRPAPAVPTTAPASTAPASLIVEAELLGRAQGSLRAGDAATALRLLEEHARRFPEGGLADERRGVRVRALCELGRSAQARAEARLLARERPDSPVAAGVADVCS